MQARARGALLGLAVGDALGTTNEGRKLPGPSFPEACDGPQVDMRGAGPYALRPGQVTDDTQMACALADSLKNSRAFDAPSVARAYVAWLPHAFAVGAQTKAVLQAITEGTHSDFAGKRYWLEHGQKPAGNGSLMRTAPLGVFFATDAPKRIAASLSDSALTHFDMRCQLACVALNAAISAAIVSPSLAAPPAEMVKAAQADLAIAASDLGRAYPEWVLVVSDAVSALKEDLVKAQSTDPELYGPDLHMLHTQGYVRVAFRLAFWELCHATAFEPALIDIVNRGGDSDTNAAVAGALLGARFGDAGIPERWREPVLEVNDAQRPVLSARYHPRELVTLSASVAR